MQAQPLSPPAVEAPTVSVRRATFRRMFRNRLSIFGCIVLGLIVLGVLVGPLIWTTSPTAQDLTHAVASPSSHHPLGTDALGRDTLARLLYGGRLSLAIALLADVLATSVGVAIGLTAGFLRSLADGVLMRLMDVLFAFPSLLLAMAVVAVVGPGTVSVLVAVAVANVPYFARLTRSVVISIRERDFVLAARASGVRRSRIMTRHVLRNSLSPVIVNMALVFGFTLLDVAALGFLGLGVQPPKAEWGAMLNDGTQYLLTSPVVVLVPGFAIALTAFSGNLVGDALNDAFDTSS